MHDIYIASFILKDSKALYKWYAYGNHFPIGMEPALGFKAAASWTNAQRHRFGQGQQLELPTLAKSDMSYREPNFPWYLQSLLYCACTNYLVASTVIAINLPLFLRTVHSQKEIAQDWKLLSLVVHQNATLLGKKAPWMTCVLRQLPRYGFSVGQHLQLA